MRFGLEFLSFVPLLRNMTRLSFLAPILSVVVLVGCASTSSNSPQTKIPPPNVGVSDAAIVPGDIIEVRITGINNPIDQQEVVNEFGTITMPYIKEVKAAGYTPGVLAQNIEKAYIDGGYYTKLSVSVIPGQREFYTRGEVRLAGRLPWTPGLTVVQAISLAGGFSDYANRSDIEIRRKDQVIKVDFKEAEKDPSKNVEIFPRDDISVKRALF